MCKRWRRISAWRNKFKIDVVTSRWSLSEWSARLKRLNWGTVRLNDLVSSGKNWRYHLVRRAWRDNNNIKWRDDIATIRLLHHEEISNWNTFLVKSLYFGTKFSNIRKNYSKIFLFNFIWRSKKEKSKFKTTWDW